jgi:hypothetical protein
MDNYVGAQLCTSKCSWEKKIETGLQSKKNSLESENNSYAELFYFL